ncbi:MAG: heme lyase CcmF/NrfE family subunit, partial [Pelagibacteraceae bacterium]
MLSEFGQLSIFFVTIFSFLIIYKSFLGLKSNNQIIEPGIYQLSLWQVTVTILSFLVLIAAYLVSDFSLINVYENSHTAKPLFYKIAGSWGNHEGSLLLWINILVIFSYLFLIFNFKHKKNFR